jgi:EAL domain-containing protein (putative c-di-GMP-specific phosphodiesterase class I)
MVITRIPVPDMVTSSLLLTVPAFGRVWQLSPVFGPIFSPDGSLIALEMLSRIADRDSGVAASPEMFLPRSP